MAFDPFLYVALAAGFVVGRLVRVPTVWVRRASLAIVVVLVGLLGGSISGLPLESLALAIPLGLGVAGAVLGLTLVVFLGLAARRTTPRPAPPPAPAEPRYATSLGLLGALGVGYGLGRLSGWALGAGIPWALYALLAVVGLDLTLTWTSVRRAWLPIAAATAGALGAAGLVMLVGVAPNLALATTLAFGWYTLAGPLIVARAGAALGLVAFLANFLRENLTMVSAPVVGPRLGGEGVAALGGATAMDTTLYFVTRYGDAEAGGLALASGLVLTLAAGLLLPGLVAL
ncbi:MAG TPA: LysO family transporter [Thermoplasmata archaeon]|nr:LysO family transporter [Thermoplasmata archaeon]